jgi:hypothetical protein
VAVRTFNGNRETDSFLFTERESRLEGQAFAAIVPSSAALRDLDTGPAVGAPSFTSSANTSTTVVVICGAFLGNEDAVVQNGTEAIGRFVGQTLSAFVVGGATSGDLDALLGNGAETESSVAIFLANGSVITKFVAFHTVTALVSGVGLVGGFVLVAEVDLRQTGFLVVGDEESGLTKVANLVNEVNSATVGNSGNARIFVGGNVETIDTGLAFQALATESGIFVGSASEDFR